MKKIYTFLKVSAFLFLFAPAVLSSNVAKAQCGAIVENFNNTGGSTGGFTGSFSYAATGTDGYLQRDKVFQNGFYTITTPTYKLSNVATTLQYGAVFGGTEKVQLTIKVTYASTLTNQIETYILQDKVVPSYDPQTQETNDVCFSTAISSIPGFPTGGLYRLQFDVTARTGTAMTGQTITFDDFRTNGTFSQIILPVTFVGFTATKVNSAVQLTWRVAGEENVSHYEVERSSDGRSFATVGSVSKTGRDVYNYTDLTASGTVYYRIKNVDNDGQFKYSTIARLANGRSEIVLKAFPQPVQGQLTVQHPSISGKALVSISTADGRMVRNIVPSEGSMQTTVDMSGLQKGMYLIRFDNGDGNAQTMKVLKQ
ncbi:T9SS type A sorting domain-containing protein [Flavisolibacter nicotianae]|uniref:T9SS type A sorting domain-containing protein n=1 Tax=Flavisolibacter nicotianae TaxID=2364882 RepID=UPI000EB1974A|nr:T9SS type A sorting domain-containing protein [Flavisolibacter nicotianae]